MFLQAKAYAEKNGVRCDYADADTADVDDDNDNDNDDHDHDHDHDDDDDDDDDCFVALCFLTSNCCCCRIASNSQHDFSCLLSRLRP